MFCDASEIIQVVHCIKPPMTGISFAPWKPNVFQLTGWCKIWNAAVTASEMTFYCTWLETHNELEIMIQLCHGDNFQGLP